MLQLCTNKLVGLSKFVGIIDLIIIRLNPHPEAPTRPSTLEVCELRNVPQFFLLLCSHLGLQLNPSRSLGVCQGGCCINGFVVMHWQFFINVVMHVWF